VITSSVSGSRKVESYLYDQSREAEWTTFAEHRHPRASAVKAPLGTCTFTPPRLPSLKQGDRVDCLGKVWSGSDSNATSGAGVTFVRIAQMRVKIKRSGDKQKSRIGQWRRFAVVGLPSGKLTFAELMSTEQGLVKLAGKATAASTEELLKLEAQLPALLASRDAENVHSLMGRLVDGGGGIALRPRSAKPQGNAVSTANAASTSGKASTATPSASRMRKAVDGAAPAATPAPKLPADLKGVSQTSFSSLSSSQLLALCKERDISVEAGATDEMLIQLLISFRQKQGRRRRASSSTDADAAASASASATYDDQPDDDIGQQGHSEGEGGGDAAKLRTHDKQSKKGRQDRKKKRKRKRERAQPKQQQQQQQQALAITAPSAARLPSEQQRQHPVRRVQGAGRVGRRRGGPQSTAEGKG